MDNIIFYADAKGNSQVYDIIKKLAKSRGKENRIRLKKIQEYIDILDIHGVGIGEPYIKHLDGEIWELRPMHDRIVFAGAINGKYVLLHQFMKKTQKTPKREIEKAKRELADFKERSGLK